MSDSSTTMWGGRFSENPDDFMVEFGASIDVDIELLEVDVMGSMAWVEALEKAGMLTEDEVNVLFDGLEKVKKTIFSELADGTFSFDRSLEDIHMTVESRLIDLVGDTGAKLHTGRSRNDQVALDERLYLLHEIERIVEMITSVQNYIVDQAESHVDTVVPSYTHLQQAQPVRLGHYLMSWFWMLDRDRERLLDARKRVDRMPLGSGAVAGSGFDIDRNFIAEKLGFSAITENSLDSVSDRDFIIETISAASILMMHLSRISEDLIVWSSAEFGFASLPERYSTGSSMMPQKKNPDSLELVRGKTGRVYGSLMSILTVMKALPFSYCKDMQEDKEPLFDTLITIEGCLRIAGGVFEGITFNTEKMKEAFDDSVFATDVADYLTKKGMPFRNAHEVAGKLVRWSQQKGVAMSEIPDDIFKEHSDLFGDDVHDLFDLLGATDGRSVDGGTGKKPLLKQIAQARVMLTAEE